MVLKFLNCKIIQTYCTNATSNNNILQKYHIDRNYPQSKVIVLNFCIRPQIKVRNSQTLLKFTSPFYWCTFAHIINKIIHQKLPYILGLYHGTECWGSGPRLQRPARSSSSQSAGMVHSRTFSVVFIFYYFQIDAPWVCMIAWIWYRCSINCGPHFSQLFWQNEHGKFVKIIFSAIYGQNKASKCSWSFLWRYWQLNIFVICLGFSICLSSRLCAVLSLVQRGNVYDNNLSYQ